MTFCIIIIIPSIVKGIDNGLFPILFVANTVTSMGAEGEKQFNDDTSSSVCSQTLLAQVEADI